MTLRSWLPPIKKHYSPSLRTNKSRQSYSYCTLLCYGIQWLGCLSGIISLLRHWHHLGYRKRNLDVNKESSFSVTFELLLSRNQHLCQQIFIIIFLRSLIKGYSSNCSSLPVRRGLRRKGGRSLLSPFCWVLLKSWWIIKAWRSKLRRLIDQSQEKSERLTSSSTPGRHNLPPNHPLYIKMTEPSRESLTDPNKLISFIVDVFPSGTARPLAA